MKLFLQFIFIIGFYYDDSSEKIPDLTAYSADIIDRYLKNSLFRFEYTINKVHKNSSFKITKQCWLFNIMHI